MLLLPSVLSICLLIRTSFGGFAEGGDSGWHGITNFGALNYGGHDVNNIPHQALSSYGSYSSLAHGFNTENVQHSVPISEHVEVTKPIAVPVVRNIGIPVAQAIAIPVPHPVAVAVPQPYPVHVPIAQPIAVPIVKTIAIPVEKKVPYPVEKIIPVPIEKAVPITVEKHVPVPVEKPYPIHIPVYKHVFHRKTKNHGYGWVY